jgi:hypothetical protein
MASTLENAARIAWRITLDGYAKFTTCNSCGEMRPCRSRRGRRFLCLDCFDQKGDTL